MRVFLLGTRNVQNQIWNYTLFALSVITFEALDIFQNRFSAKPFVPDN